MPRYHVLEIKFKTKTLLPCKEKRVGMTDDEAADRSARELIAIGKAIRDQHKRNLGRQYPPSSRPGEYPARRTGSLKNGIFFDPEKLSRISRNGNARITIGYSNKNAKAGKRPYDPGSPYGGYGLFLVNRRGRKGIVDTMRENMGLLNQSWKPVEFRVINPG